MERVKVADLNMNIKSPVIRGIIIHSQDLQFCEKNSGCDTVWAFTLRDSTIDTIIVKYWGNKPNIEKVYTNYHVGDVVEIRWPKIYCRQYAHESEKHYPSVSSNYLLWCKDGRTIICRCTPEESKEYTHLLHIPCQDITACMPLENVSKTGKSIHRSYFNFFVTILSVSRKQIYYRTDLGKVIFRKKLIVTDRSLAQHQIILWDDENIFRSRNWIPRKTILFIVEAHILWSNRHKSNSIVVDKKTIITENPAIPETELMRNFFSIPEDNDISSPDLSTCNYVRLPNELTKEINTSPHYVTQSDTIKLPSGELPPGIRTTCMAMSQAGMKHAHTYLCNDISMVTSLHDSTTKHSNLPSTSTTDNVLALPAEPSITDDLHLLASLSDESVLMSVEELLTEAMVKPPPGFYIRPRPFKAVLHCFIMDKNLDRPTDILSFTCNECKEIASPYGCYDYHCTGNTSEPSRLMPHFQCVMQLADRTGTLPNCIISEQTAQNILGHSAEDFLARTKVEIYNLKWFFTINQFEAKLLVTPIVCGPPHIKIISLKQL